MVETNAMANGDLHVVGDRAQGAQPIWVAPVLTVIPVVDTQFSTGPNADGMTGQDPS